MLYEMSKIQKIIFAISALILFLLVIACMYIIPRYFNDGISIDSLAAWIFGIMATLLLDRYFISFMKHRIMRIILTLLIAGSIAVIGQEMQIGDIPFVGFSNKWFFVAIASFLVILELQKDTTVQKGPIGRKQTKKRKRRRRR